MLSKGEALALVQRELGDSAKVAHSLLVGRLMKGLAAQFQANAELWEIVGILHDLDYPATEFDLTQHGLVTVRMLGDSLPPEALQAIAAHDHRSGLRADSLLARSLRAADALAAIASRVPPGELAQLAGQGEEACAALREKLGQRAYLSDMVEEYAKAYSLTPEDILKIL